MVSCSRKGQGALEYLLLIGGAVVVAVIVIFIMIGLAGSTGNQANAIIGSSFGHIQGLLGGEEPASPAAECATAADCVDAGPCTTVACSGTPLACVYSSITTCTQGDSCCPVGCDNATDSDCPAPPAECATAADCDDADPCTADACSGTPLACVHSTITACTTGDSCCPAGCMYGLDNDCPVPPTGSISISPAAVNIAHSAGALILTCSTNPPTATCLWSIQSTDPGGIGGTFTSATGQTVRFIPNSVGFYRFKLAITNPTTGATTTLLSNEVESYLKETFDTAVSLGSGSSLPNRYSPGVFPLWEWYDDAGNGRLHGTNYLGPCDRAEYHECGSSAPMSAITGINFPEPYSVEVDFKYACPGGCTTAKFVEVAVLSDSAVSSGAYYLTAGMAGQSFDNDERIKIFDTSWSDTLLKDASTSSWQPDLWNHFKIVRIGNALSGKFALNMSATPASAPTGQAITNAAGATSATDPTPRAAGRAGVYMRGLNVYERDIYFDNFEVHHLK